MEIEKKSRQWSGRGEKGGRSLVITVVSVCLTCTLFSFFSFRAPDSSPERAKLSPQASRSKYSIVALYFRESMNIMVLLCPYYYNIYSLTWSIVFMVFKLFIF